MVRFNWRISMAEGLAEGESGCLVVGKISGELIHARTITNNLHLM